MARDIKGNAVKDYGKEKINTLSAPRSEYPVKSRESEEKHEKPKKHLNDMAGTEVEKAEDTDNNPDARKNPEAFDQHIERMQEHHDRLQMIEKHLGMNPKGKDMSEQAQKAMGSKLTAGHITEKKGSAAYGRKRH